jgi:hypothetical protein
VEYSGYTLHAKTSIPQKIEEVKFNALPVEGRDSLRILTATFNIDPSKKCSYRAYTLKSSDGYYLTNPMLYNPNLSMVGVKTFTISPSPTKQDSSFAQGSYFAKGDLITIKLCAIDSTATQFYKGLDTFSASTGIGSNFFIGEKDALQSNISYPGFGIWCGKGTKHFTYLIP